MDQRAALITPPSSGETFVWFDAAQTWLLVGKVKLQIGSPIRAAEAVCRCQTCLNAAEKGLKSLEGKSGWPEMVKQFGKVRAELSQLKLQVPSMD